MRNLWWVMLVFAIGSLGYNIAKHLEYRRRQSPLPAYWSGGVWGALSMVLLIVSNLLDLESPVGMLTLGASCALLAVAILQSVRAERRRV